MPGRSGEIVTLLVAALLLPACAARVPEPVTLPRPDLSPASHIDQIYGYPAAVAAIAAVLERELGVPPFPVTFHFYRNVAAFEAALLELGHDRPTARQTATVMRGIGTARRVLLNTEALDPISWQDRVRVLAHELVHSLQYELAGGRRGASEQWLREGFAEWVALMILDRLRGRPLGELREQQMEVFRTSDRSRAPRLDSMVSFPQWIAIVERRDIAPYSQAFLAVDFLVERHTAPAIVEYFRQFASTRDRNAAFLKAFGEDRAAFETALDARLRIRRR